MLTIFWSLNLFLNAKLLLKTNLRLNSYLKKLKYFTTSHDDFVGDVVFQSLLLHHKTGEGDDSCYYHQGHTSPDHQNQKQVVLSAITEENNKQKHHSVVIMIELHQEPLISVQVKHNFFNHLLLKKRNFN